MGITQIITVIIGSMAGIGILLGGIGYVLQAYKKAGRQERSDVTESADGIVEFWKKQAEEFKEIAKTKDAEFTLKLETVTKDFNDKIQGLTKQVGELTGQLNAEKTQNDRLEKIFQNRDPQTQKFMEHLTNVATASQKFMEEWKAQDKQHMDMWEKMITVLNDIHTMSSSNHRILDSRKTPVKIQGTMQSDTPQI